VTQSSGRAGGGGFDSAQRRILRLALQRGEDPPCPACGAPLALHPVETPPEVAYVRKRILLVCPRCHRSGAFENLTD
jgi:hypothetical protein